MRSRGTDTEQDDCGCSSTLPRRNLLKMAGAAGLALGAGTLLERTAAAADPGVGDFVRSLLHARAAAATSGDASLLAPFYDPANLSMWRFETERARFLNRGLTSKWDVAAILRYLSSATIDSIDLQGAHAVVRATEQLEDDWMPNLYTPSRDELKLAAEFPERFQRTAPRGPRGEILGMLEIPHEFELQRGLSGWRVVRHEHDEFVLYGRSPDLQPGGWAAVWYGTNRTGRGSSEPTIPPTKGPGLKKPLATNYSYSPAAAVAYARQYVSTYHPSYCDYNACGGDCTNFVSQCFRNGGEIDQSPWNTFSGGCGTCSPPYSRPYAGTDTWANVDYCHSFMTSHGRATTKSNIYELGDGDYVDYNFGAGFFNGHKAIITDRWTGDPPKITCHTPNYRDQPWNIFSAVQYRYGFMYWWYIV
jgi:hypothetical protein